MEHNSNLVMAQRPSINPTPLDSGIINISAHHLCVALYRDRDQLPLDYSGGLLLMPVDSRGVVDTDEGEIAIIACRDIEDTNDGKRIVNADVVATNEFISGCVRQAHEFADTNTDSPRWGVVGVWYGIGLRGFGASSEAKEDTAMVWIAHGTGHFTIAKYGKDGQTADVISTIPGSVNWPVNRITPRLSVDAGITLGDDAFYELPTYERMDVTYRAIERAVELG